MKFHKPAMFVLVETKRKDYKILTSELKFDSHIQVAANGHSRGIVIMWNGTTLR